MQNKSITKIIIKNQIRIYLSDYRYVVQEILNKHNYLPFPNLIMANAIASFAPLSFLYDSKKMMIRIKTNGAIESLIVEVNENNVRALIANPNISTEYDKEKINEVPLILGIGDQGILQVSRVINNETFTSDVPLVRSDVVTDVAYYLNNSDQIFSAVLNDVWMDKDNPNKVIRAKNVIFQLLPDHSEEDVEWIEQFIKKIDFKSFSLDEYEKKIDGKVLDTKFINTKCWCNKNKIINAINLLSIKEKEKLFKNIETIESKCDFCNQLYQINKKDC